MFVVLASIGSVSCVGVSVGGCRARGRGEKGRGGWTPASAGRSVWVI